jgi:hypothetical protein
VKTKQELYDELLTFTFVDWHLYTIVFAMIDARRVTTLECQHPQCVLETRTFAKKSGRGQRDGLVLDHIDSRANSGSHHITNLRIVHNSCNAGWRRGIIGTFMTDEARERCRESALRQHAEGRGPNYQDPSRNKKISQALKGRMSEASKKGWETRRARMASGD